MCIDPTQEQRHSADLHVRPDGTVAQVLQSGGGIALRQCIPKALEPMRFPPFEPKGGLAKVSMQILLE